MTCPAAFTYTRRHSALAAYESARRQNGYDMQLRVAVMKRCVVCVLPEYDLGI